MFFYLCFTRGNTQCTYGFKLDFNLFASVWMTSGQVKPYTMSWHQACVRVRMLKSGGGRGGGGGGERGGKEYSSIVDIQGTEWEKTPRSSSLNSYQINSAVSLNFTSPYMETHVHAHKAQARYCKVHHRLPDWIQHGCSYSPIHSYNMFWL